MSASDTFAIASALLFGPAPATVALAVLSSVMSWRRGHGWTRLRLQRRRAGAVAVGCRAGLFPHRARRAALGESAVGRRAHRSIVLLHRRLFRLEHGADGDRHRARIEAVASDRLAAALSPLWLSLSYLAAASVAFCLILLIRQMSLGAVAVILPVVAVFHLTLRSSSGRVEDANLHVAQVDRLYLSTVETLAMAIDAKDDVTHSHVVRVQAYALGLARALGITDELELKAIEAAALLHDTGKLAVPEHILNKPGKLTDAEFEKMKRHVDVGADILSLVQFPYPVVPIVQCHHECWDGTGYPRGVAGEDIPIGARILSVVDCFDAITSDRPYRGRMTEAAALQILRERSGSMYDPHVVATFIEVYQSIPIAPGTMVAGHEVLQRIHQSRHEIDAPPEPVSDVAVAASTNLLAFVSLARAAAGDASVADVLALGSSASGRRDARIHGRMVPARYRARSARRRRGLRPGCGGASRDIGAGRRTADRMGGGETPADHQLGRDARSRRARGFGHTAAVAMQQPPAHGRRRARRGAHALHRRARRLHGRPGAARPDRGASTRQGDRCCGAHRERESRDGPPGKAGPAGASARRLALRSSPSQPPPSTPGGTAAPVILKRSRPRCCDYEPSSCKPLPQRNDWSSSAEVSARDR